jgi:hypothetical protein
MAKCAMDRSDQGEALVKTFGVGKPYNEKKFKHQPRAGFSSGWPREDIYSQDLKDSQIHDFCHTFPHDFGLPSQQASTAISYTEVSHT